MPYFTDNEFEFDTSRGYLSGAQARFYYDKEWSDGPDFTGWEITRCEVESVSFGHLSLTREQLAVCDRFALERAETKAADTILEALNCGDLIAAE